MNGPREDLSPEERVERVRMALAEAGYPDAGAWWDPEAGDSGRVVGHWTPVGIPLDVQWRAGAIAGAVTRCWPCFRDDPSAYATATCDHDPLTSPWPEVSRG